MQYWLICNQPEMAKIAVNAGVGRIFVDLERHGKVARQAGRDTFISGHRMTDIASIRQALPETELMVRVNPIHQDSDAEINQAIDYGADLIMLPMITAVNQVEQLIVSVAGRAKIVLLIETAESVELLAKLVGFVEVDEVYIGLNDLHLALGLDFMFQPVADGLIDHMVQVIKQAKKPFGFGGIAKIGQGLVPAEKILAEHMRLGSSRVILSRAFLQGGEFETFIADEINKLRTLEAELQMRDSDAIVNDQRDFQHAVLEVVTQL